MNHYLYALLDRMPAQWRPPAGGIGGASVVPRRVDDVVVLTSVVESVPSPNPRTLALHHDIVTTVMEAAALLPFPYGTTVPVAALSEWLAAHRAVVTAALAAVRDCVEMSVKLLRLDCAIEEQVARGRRGGGRYGLSADERQLRALADTLVERANLPEWRYRPSGSGGNVVGSVAFLVPRPDLSGFLARIAPVASRAVGVAVVPTGPWPPYSFVPAFYRVGGPEMAPHTPPMLEAPRRSRGASR